MRAARTDENHTAIVQALLDAGCSVQSLAAVGCGCPDLVVGFAGVNVLLEIKREKLSGGVKPGTWEAQSKFREFWKGQQCIVRSPEEAMAAVRAALEAR